ncbi:MAG: hypothetical protein MSG64_15095 [Pyrinomonadaceae bacterium MAG19_C2-C3]|nr:hypothetical protein [Pyrinomonadaceae bacterium MAG19_C2-C3]
MSESRNEKIAMKSRVIIFPLAVFYFLLSITTHAQTAAPMIDGAVNLAHLNYLNEEIKVDNQPVLLTHIYADAPGYAWTDAAGEGIAALDDTARATIVYLDFYAKTGNVQALERARAGLNFTLYMQATDGEFYNFIVNREGLINRDGVTSRKSLDWWAYRGLWSLARGISVFKDVDKPYAERLEIAYLKTENLIAARLANVGKWIHVHGFRVPAWLPNNAADSTGVLILALAEYQARKPNDETKKLLTTFADAISNYQLGSGKLYPFAMHPHTIAAPGFWHAWGAHEAQGLARAGHVLGRRDYIESARREIENLFAWQLATGRVHELGVLPRFEGQQVYGVNCMVQACVNLYKATGEIRYAKMAGLHASWLTGNNFVGAKMYDANTGRGYDGLDVIDGERKVNRNSGAESTIEALMILQSVIDMPEAEKYLDYKVTSQRGWQIIEAEDGRVVTGQPVIKSADEMNEARISGGRYYELKNGDAININFDVTDANDYVLYVARLRRALAVTHRQPPLRQARNSLTSRKQSSHGALVLQFDNMKRLIVPETVSPDRDFMWLDLVAAQPVKLQAGKHTLRVSYRSSDRDARTIIDGFLLQPAIATKTLQSPTGARLNLRYDMRKGALTWRE